MLSGAWSHISCSVSQYLLQGTSIVFSLWIEPLSITVLQTSNSRFSASPVLRKPCIQLIARVILLHEMKKIV